MQQPQYKFYPTLLDAYKWYASNESEDAEQELIDKINRVPFLSDAADKGTWFNELIDIALKGKQRFKEQYLSGVALEICEFLDGSVSQMLVSTVFDVDGVCVEVYGYLDYLKQDIVIDLKTTKSYDLGKYKNSMQRHFYPVALIDSGNEISRFVFAATDFQNLYLEPFPVNYEESKKEVIETCRQLIQFINAKADKITDKKIFNLQPETVL